MTPATYNRRLVLIGGPIASGKTSVAFELAARARRTGRSAAAMDIDVLVEMVGGTDWSRITQEHRLLAPVLAAKLIAELFESGYGFVAVAGSTLTPYEWDELLSQLPESPPALRVRLRVSLDESVRRAQADLTRVATREPAVVARHYARIDWQTLPPADIEVPTDDLSLDEVADAIEKHLVAP